jgi:MoaF-like
MNYVGKTFLFDYHEFLVRVDYKSDRILRWEQIKGSSPGLTAEETYNSTEVRSNIHMISWQEKDDSVVVQIIDWERERVFTTWIGSDKKVHHFQGNIRTS